MGLCSCLASCLAWGIQHCSLLVVEWSWVLALRRRALGELSPIDITRGREVSGGQMSWTRLSHLIGSGLTPGQSTKTLSATWLSFHPGVCLPEKWAHRSHKACNSSQGRWCHRISGCSLPGSAHHCLSSWPCLRHSPKVSFKSYINEWVMILPHPKNLQKTFQLYSSCATIIV